MQDTTETQYAEATVRGKVETATRETDIQGWETEFADILTKEPSLTSLVQFRIETGLHPPICQGPYNTPQALVKSVDKELEWLKDKGYIRESSSSWASPMVTVRKPDSTARLCINCKAINAVTTPLPFYMPRVEEVLERVGKCSTSQDFDELQHWLLRIEYLPGRENGLADALSREERKRMVPIITTDASLVVGTNPPARKPSNGEYPGKKKRTCINFY